LAVALTAAWCALHEAAKKPDLAAIRNLWIDAGPSDREWLTCIQRIFDAHESGADVREFACQLGLQWGVGGYAYHSIPVALYSWLHHFGDYRTSVEAVLNCGGDTDSVAAITGALASCHSPIPREWMVRLYDFPISTAYLQTLASALKNNSKSPIFPWMLLPLRNLLFLIVVLAHGFRRLVPI
jgi:ADP-ribosylglycohydrolase